MLFIRKLYILFELIIEFKKNADWAGIGFQVSFIRFCLSTPLLTFSRRRIASLCYVLPVITFKTSKSLFSIL